MIKNGSDYGSDSPLDSPSDYHRLELSIATDPADPRRIMPPVEPRHRRILDVGCGAGQTLIGANLATDVFAVGIDSDHSALRLGREFTSTVNFVLGQGESLPFRSESFDLVLCRVALPYMHVATALSEMARVTGPGGDLWLVLHPFSMSVKELVTNIGRLQVKAGFYRLWVMTNGLGLHFLGRQWGWPMNPSRFESSQTKSGIQRALLAAGFDQIRINHEKHFVVTASKP